MSISERLKQVIESKNINIKEFSELSGIPYRSVQNYLRNEREPNVEALTKLKETMNIDVNWLLTGEGKMFQGLPSDELAEKEQALINHYRQMSNDVQRAMEVAFKAIYENNK
ncbi:transcriptional regulator [Canicola haemoglobinophilus]|uniref:Transcriptional regulator n=1 Tax=Canicola haemoglobinophilus TaxID=733 RepID=A0A1V4AY85_9PAST|nr:helix-turn-helix transcriptional regulator [Canicola haemoglobinophilus]OOR95130.1 transcriptional regulator [Canicola haemoglobinophilus]STO55390.1 transcriptional regulator [Canicola haemoglobinophilus]STO59693.1 transcriptional regulator [Canicola haemoglobinophilus]STO69041.1 transcriptional regulator [Canicola haemoglobinophilus]